MDVKVCTKCGVEKPLDEFHRSRAKQDGKCSRCKKCDRLAKRKWIQDDPARYRAYCAEHRKAKGDEIRAYLREWYRNNPEKVAAYRARNRFAIVLNGSRNHAKKHGYAPCSATVGEIATAFTGKCHVCGVPEDECNSKLCMDHDHVTGKFRGWLCHHCNSAAGLLGESSDRILALAEYVARSETNECFKD